MRKLFVYSTLLFVMLGIATSCQKETTPSEQYIKETILGKWRLVSINDKEALTNFTIVDTYNPAGDNRTSHSNYNTWRYQEGVSYTISENKIIRKMGTRERIETVLNINESSFTIEILGHEPSEEGVQSPFVDGNYKFIRTLADYHVSILGTWEGVEMTGEETFGDYKHRWEYKSDGTYTYYNKDEGGNWIASDNVGNEYYVDGDFLASRWKNNAESDYNYEWWIITSCNSTEMTWSALREKKDGTRYTTTFKMKRIEEVRSPRPE